MNTNDVKNLYDEFVLGTYSQLPVCLVKGKGSFVWDIEGKQYLDFFPGWAVSGLGHCPSRVVSAIKHQAEKILHVSNNFYNSKQAKLAEKISEHAFDCRTFFCNSGAESIEAAIKFARKYGSEKGRYEFITMEKSFHGRTLAAVTATGQAKYHDGFHPMPEGFKYAKYNDIDSLRKLVSNKTVAVIMEPIQGEGGVHVADKEYIEAVRKVCDENEMLLIFDEVQTGMGRTGKMFAYQHYCVEPDLMTLAKTLGGGVPIGALVVNKKLKNYLLPGTHASTFGGNPLVAAASLAVFKTIEKDGLLNKTVELGQYLLELLGELKKKYDFITEIRGVGLMVGVECARQAGDIVKKAMEKGLLVNCTQGNILRIMPAMTVNKKLIDDAVAILDKSIEECL